MQATRHPFQKLGFSTSRRRAVCPDEGLDRESMPEALAFL
ncbi:hypothetical protein AVDCRST_MAG94-5321 [uncultured Leptolyngbya sp.]|uniref:Uncharacterized protein n=1 Tax=uncultured Leptolyngbya sp. TaxID=332963 RepID=A0A6J4NK78_9CYAN|nr:hypothetical protein AVDCRST_MAG94-5321 [uncultured Leptolyngbya sp.]